MSVKERNQNLNMVAEIVREHLFEHLDDDGLCKDMCAVLAVTLRRVYEDAEKSAQAWDKRAYHSKADTLRREMAWALSMAQLAESLAYSPRKFAFADLEQLVKLLPSEHRTPKRTHVKDVERWRGAAAAARQTLLKKR
jgi:hypothetical protein